MPAYKDSETGKWYASFYYDDWSGKRLKKKKSGFNTRKEALRWESDFLSAEDTSMNITMEKFVDIYFQDKSIELKDRSIRNKRYMIDKYITPYLGKRAMNKIFPADIIRWQGIIKDMGFKPTYQRMVNNQLVALFNHAQKIYGLQHNPCSKVKRLGKSDAEKLSFWTREEYDRFIATVEKGSTYYIIFQILFWTGCREGELLALTINDFDFENNTINIDKTYFRANRKDVITEPKTDNSVRTITIPESLKEEIKTYISRLYKYPTDYRIFDMTDRAVQKALKRYIKTSGVKDIRVHDLRHTYAPRLFEADVSIKTIQTILGHSSITITEKTYVHVMHNVKTDAVKSGCFCVSGIGVPSISSDILSASMRFCSRHSFISAEEIQLSIISPYSVSGMKTPLPVVFGNNCITVPSFVLVYTVIVIKKMRHNCRIKYGLYVVVEIHFVQENILQIFLMQIYFCHFHYVLYNPDDKNKV